MNNQGTCRNCLGPVEFEECSFGIVAYCCPRCATTGLAPCRSGSAPSPPALAAAVAVTPSTENPLQTRFLHVWGQYKQPGLRDPVAEYHGIPDRQFAFDFAWPDLRVAVECEGIDHRRVQRYHRDVEKYNLATRHGWRVLRCTARLLRDKPENFVFNVCVVLEEASG